MFSDNALWYREYHREYQRFSNGNPHSLLPIPHSPRPRAGQVVEAERVIKEVIKMKMRIKKHPVLEEDSEPDITIFFDGRALAAKRGEPVAAALLAAGVRVFRETAKQGLPRGVFCGIGRCTDCVMVVDGEPNVRTCVTPAREGMKVETQRGLGAWGKEE